MEMLNYGETGERIGLSEDQVNAAVGYFRERQYLAHMTLGGTATLTAAAIDEVERRRRDREAAAVAALAIVSVAEMRQIEAALTALDRAGVPDKLAGSDRAEFEADLATATAQMRSPRPNDACSSPYCRVWRRSPRRLAPRSSPTS